jgi:hypothetical protein
MAYMSLPRTARPQFHGASRVGRLRPGERPCWLELPLSDDEIAGMRQHSACRGLAVDARVALLLEAQLVDRDLRAAGAPALDQLHEQALVEGQRDALAPSPELRMWIAMLRGNRTTAAEADELPCLALPTRLVTRIAPIARTNEVLQAASDDTDRVEVAVACDLAAALVGRTLESWAYAASLKRVAGTS